MSGEIKYQAKVSKAMESSGFYVIRLRSTDKAGIADLLCLKHCNVIFIEVKGKGGRIAPLQQYRAEEQKARGFKHFFTFDGDNFLTEIVPDL